MINKTKRLMVPRVVKIPRKTFFWAPTPSAGRYGKDQSITILSAIRDYLRISDKERECTRILVNGLVKVDGKVVKDRRFAIGFMDVLEISGKFYRVLYNDQGALVILPEAAERSDLKPLKIKNKTIAPGNKIQLGFHDGRVLITDNKDYRVGDVLISKMPEMEVQNVIKFQPGSKAFITGGSHVGTVATISKIEVKSSSSSNLVHFEEGFSTIKDHVFVIGNQRYTFNLNQEEVAK